MTTGTLIARARVVKTLAGHLADRDAFIVLVDPRLAENAIKRLHLIPEWTGYIDNGADTLIRTNEAGLLLLTHTLMPAAIILTVPKTIPADTLSEAFGQHIPADGSQDLLVLTTPGDDTTVWPLIFVDAMERVDSEYASAIRAARIPNPF